jgi:hypothetical protein
VSARPSHSLSRVFCALAFLGGCLVGTTPGAGQVTPAAGNRIIVTIRSDGPNKPASIDGPNGIPLEDKGTHFQAPLTLPAAGQAFFELVVNYGFGSFPLRLRLHPQSTDMQVTIGVDRPKSCADVYLKPLEKPTLTPNASIRAAFTLGYLIDGRSGPDSCDFWPFRAARARFDRYYNAMERSGFMVIPDGVKDALRSAAANDGDRRAVDKLIARSETAETQRLAVTLQRNVLEAIADRDFVTAHATSEVLLEAADEPDLADAVTSQISREVIEKQTRDLAERASTDESTPQ